MSLAISYCKAFWQFARPKTLILIWLHIVVGYVFLSSEIPSILLVMLALGASALGYVSAVAINDLSDEEVDVLNLPHQDQVADRPIVNKTLSRLHAWIIAIMASLLCIILCLILNLWLGLGAIIMIFLNTIYSLQPIQVSRRGGFAQALLPIMYVVFPFCIAVSLTKSVTELTPWLVGGLYAVFVGRLFLKDIRDEDGDRTVGKKTYLVRHGLKPTLIQAGVWTIGGLIVSSVVMILRIGELPVTFCVMAIACVGVIWALRACFKAPILEYKLLYVAMMGRFASLWMFYIVIALILSYTNLLYVQKTILLILSAAIFLAGVLVLHEELQATKRSRVIKRHRQVL